MTLCQNRLQNHLLHQCAHNMLVGLSAARLDAHQFYISITTIQHNPETKVLSIRVKIFVNDLEEAIYQKEGIRIGYWKGEPVEKAQTYVETYVSSRLSIAINDSHVQLKFLNLQVEPAEVVEDHVIICQLAADNISEITSIKVHNSILLDTIDSQTNIIKIQVNDRRKAITLDKRLPEDEVSF